MGRISIPLHLSRSKPTLGTRVRSLGFWLLVSILGTCVGEAATVPGMTATSADESAAVKVPIDLTPAEREQLLARLSDTQVRDLIFQIWQQAMPATGATDEDAMGGLMANAELFQTNFRATLGAFPDVPGLVPLFFSSMIPEGRGALHLLLLFLGLVVVFGIGFGTRYLFQRGTAGVKERLASNLGETESSKLQHLIMLWLLDLAGVVAFVMGAMAAFFVLHAGHDPIRLLVLIYVGATFAFLAVSATSKFLFSPGDRLLRALPIGDADGANVHRNFLMVAAYAAYSSATIQLLGRLSPNVHPVVLLGLFNGAIIISLLCHFVWTHRRVFADVIRPREALSSGDKIRLAFSRSWHAFYIAGFLLLYAVITYSDFTGFAGVTGAAYGTLFIMFGLPFVLSAISQCIGTGETTSEVVTEPVPVDGEDADEHGTAGSQHVSTNKGRGYLKLVQRTMIMIVIISALVAVADMWGTDLMSMSRTGIGAAIFGAMIEIALALFLAYMIWEIVKIAMAPYMPHEGAGAGPADEGGGTGASRITTLMPLLQKFLLITLVTMAIMVVLSSLGVNIGPLIAGAGVIGLAIGFGAQALVKDIISGVFFLMDDAFRRGEYIDIGSVKGTVERISIRSLQMRHHNGPIHTVPYGEIQYVTNFSRDWAIMKFELRIPFEVDIDKVRRIIKKTGQAMLEDEEFGPLILEPLKSQGVNRMDDSALIVRCKFTAIPGQQFYVRREAFTRIQEAFDRAGIKFAPKRVIVETTGGDDSESAGAVRAAPTAAATAAAAAAAETPVESTAGADDRG